jgi:chemotaxis signal transduction protein
MTTVTAQKTERSNHILTFVLGHTRFAIHISSILSITDDFGKVELSSNHQHSFLGYLYYRNKPVNVYECSTLLGRDSNRTNLEASISSLNQSEAAHVSWLNKLEQSIVNDTIFSAQRDPTVCEFGHWLELKKHTADDAAKALLVRFEGPHEEFHKLADVLLEVASKDGKDAALKQLAIAKRGRISEFMRLFNYTKSQLNSAVHPVVLYITRDGATPWFALVLDSMSDIVSYEDNQFTQMRDPDDLSTESHPDPVYGYVHNSETDEKDSLVLSAARLAYLIEH